MVRDVRYLCSQPRPFPNSLMIGAHAELDDLPNIDTNELTMPAGSLAGGGCRARVGPSGVLPASATHRDRAHLAGAMGRRLEVG
jgi:hypothetical protein